MSVLRRAGTVAVLTVALAVASVGTAAGAPPYREVFHDQWSDVIEDFCGDLEVRVDGDFSGSLSVGRRGPDGLEYFRFAAHGSIAWTNLATNKTMTSYQDFIDKDLKVTDNGDGTLSIIGMATGGDRVFGPNGRLILKDPGQIRYELLIDNMGTPGDSSDDELIADLGIIKGSTGANGWSEVDFCDFVHAVLG